MRIKVFSIFKKGSDNQIVYYDERTFEMENAIFFKGLSPNELAVYAYLHQCAGKRYNCKAKVKTIARACGCSESTVRRALHKLRDNGYLDIRASGQLMKNGLTRQGCNEYYLLSQSTWKEIKRDA